MADEEKEIKILTGKLIESSPAKKKDGTLVKGTRKDGEGWQIFDLQMLIEGKVKKVSSFNAQHTDLVDKYVKAEVEVKKDGKYTNYTLKKIEEMTKEDVAKDEGVVTEQEEVVGVDYEDEEGSSEMTEKEGRKIDPDTTEGKKRQKEILEEVKPDWIGKEKRSIRGMCVSYCKDLVNSDKIKIEEIIDKAQGMFEYIWDGIKEEKKE